MLDSPFRGVVFAFTSVKKPVKNCYKKKRAYIKEELKALKARTEPDERTFDVAVRYKCKKEKGTATVEELVKIGSSTRNEAICAIDIEHIQTELIRGHSIGEENEEKNENST